MCNRDSVSSTSLRIFTAGENGLVYNTLTKKNDIGTVQNVVGKNCYNVNIEGVWCIGKMFGAEPTFIRTK